MAREITYENITKCLRMIELHDGITEDTLTLHLGWTLGKTLKILKYLKKVGLAREISIPRYFRVNPLKNIKLSKSDKKFLKAGGK